MANAHSVIFIRGSTSALITRLVSVLFLIETIYAGLLIGAVILTSNVDITTPSIIFLWVVHTVKFFAIIYFIIQIVAEHIATSSYLTKSHLVVDKGIFNIDEEVYELGQLRRIKVHQNSIGRRLGYGTIELKFSAPSFEKTITLPYVASPRKYEELIEEHLKR